MKLNLLLSALCLSAAFAQDLSFDPTDTALVLTDLQNDFLSQDGVAWGVVGDSVVEHNTIENLGRLLRAAKDQGFLVFISPHYYYPHDHDWEHQGLLEQLMHDIGMFDREDALSLEGFEGSGADWLDVFKEYIAGDNVIVTNPHKVYGPESNDLALQLRKRKIDRVILSGMSANLCVESHLRELLEQGFDVSVVTDATAAAKTPDLGDGYSAAITNFKFLANAVVDTTQAIQAMGGDPLIEFPVALGTHRRIVYFAGQSESVGTIDDVNVMTGTSVTIMTAFPSFEESNNEFLGCFKVDLKYFISREKVGYGVDCVWMEQGNLNAVTFYSFDGEGVIVSAGRTSIAPFTPGFGANPVVPALEGAPNAQLLSGHFPGEENSLLEATGSFQGYTGRIRLSGAFAMPEGSPPVMNCIWEMDFTLPSSVAIARMSGVGNGGTRKLDASDGEAKVQVWQFLGKAALIDGGFDKAKEMAGIEGLVVGDMFSESEIEDFLGCFEVPMRNFVTAETIGTGIDCIYTTPAVETTTEALFGVAAITFYILNDGGSLVSSGFTSVGAVSASFGDGPVNFSDAGSPNVGFLTGSIPKAGENSIATSTGMYAGTTGSIRLSGGMYMGDEVHFNCIWEAELTVPMMEVPPGTAGDAPNPTEVGLSSGAAAAISLLMAGPIIAAMVVATM